VARLVIPIRSIQAAEHHVRIVGWLERRMVAADRLASGRAALAHRGPNRLAVLAPRAAEHRDRVTEYPR
jgi:hypothetical protein